MTDLMVTSPSPAAFSLQGAVAYTGCTRTFIYENRHRLDWLKAGRRSLITRVSLDRLLAELPRVNTVAKKQKGGRK
jgi:hypothetical protein